MPKSVDLALGATYKEVSFRAIDKSGDKTSVTVKCRAGTTTNDVDNALTALALASNANFYQVSIADVWKATPTSAAALAASKNSVHDAIVIGYAKPDGANTRVHIPAPLETIMVGNSDNVDIANALYSDVRDAFEALLDAAYEPTSVRFNERRELNKPSAAE